ncbi:MAG: hypothetical protein K2K60_06015 [Clostridia bacterium]|nr:hypothetical protein [Clostridia bacterium]
MDNIELNTEDLFAALKENNITVESFAEEIKLLLNSFFTCYANSHGKNIMVDFLNGQRFKITVKNIKR